MTAFRYTLPALALFAVSALPALAQRVEVQPKIEPRLLAADTLDKLKLSKEQLDKYAKIETDFKDAVKAAAEKFRTDVANLTDRSKSNINVLQDATFAANKKARTDQLAKFESILTADQNALYAQLKLQPVQPGGGRPIQIGGGQGINPVLPPAVQNRLQLTEEQKKQIDDIQKEVEAKIMKVLTEEQRKVLEQIKKAPAIRPNPIPLPPIQLPPAQIRPINPPVDPAVPNPRKS